MNIEIICIIVSAMGAIAFAKMLFSNQSTTGTRYFLVFWQGAADGRIIRVGNSWVKRTHGKYMNREIVIKTIRKELPDTDTIVITNITELSEKDFNSWTDTDIE